MSVSDFFTLLGACVVLLIASVLYDVWKHQRSEADDYDKSDGHGQTDDPRPEPALPPVAATATEALPPVAMPRNERNDELSRNESNERLRVQADILARLLQAGVYLADGKGGYRLVKQTAMIKLATGIVPNGRAESEYGKLRAELDTLINPQLVIATGRPEERQIAKV